MKLEAAVKNWDFADKDIHFMTHGLHPYPAKMIPQVAENLLKTYGRKNPLVLDPFCGSGGVLVEATRLNLNSIGLDINPLASLLSRVKSTPINPSKILDEWSRIRKKIDQDLALHNLKQLRPEIPNFGNANIEYWFKPYMIDELSIIKSNLDLITNSKLRDFFYVCFSNTVRLVSGTRKGEFKLYRIPVEKWHEWNPPIFKTFSDRVEVAISKMGEYYNYIIDNKIDAKSHVFNTDTRDLFTDKFDKGAKKYLYEGSIGLIVTSPPYGDSHTTVAYGQFSRYSSVWLGVPYDQALEVDKNCIGGKSNGTSIDSDILDTTVSKIKDLKRRQEVHDFFVDLKKCLSNLERVLAEDGYACFVLGNRTVNGVTIPSDQILADLGHEIGLREERRYHRNIPNKRMPWKSSPTNITGEKVDTITKESLVILKK